MRAAAILQNSARIADFLYRQRPAISQKGRLLVIVGRRTFGAATDVALDLRKATNAIIVSEPSVTARAVIVKARNTC